MELKYKVPQKLKEGDLSTPLAVTLQLVYLNSFLSVLILSDDVLIQQTPFKYLLGTVLCADSYGD